MTGPDAIDDTADDHVQLETELIAQDRDATRVSTADVDETSAQHLVGDLLKDDVVIPVAEQCVLVHEPSSKAFDFITQLAVFHRGCAAARGAGEEDA
jgi:hypothetical protein